MNCPYCGGNNIEEGIVWSMTAQSGNVGLAYKMGFIIGTESVYSDLCLDCGTIVRSYVREPNKKWYKKKKIKKGLS